MPDARIESVVNELVPKIEQLGYDTGMIWSLKDTVAVRLFPATSRAGLPELLMGRRGCCLLKIEAFFDMLVRVKHF